MGGAASVDNSNAYVHLQAASNGGRKNVMRFHCPPNMHNINDVEIIGPANPKSMTAILSQVMGVTASDLGPKNGILNNRKSTRKVVQSDNFDTEKVVAEKKTVPKYSNEEDVKAERIRQRALKVENVNDGVPDIPPTTEFPNCEFSKETLTYLRTPGFDVWQWTVPEMMSLAFHMFVDLDVIEPNQVDVNCLKLFILTVKATYRNNPFHNFRHAFCVAQMMFGLVHLLEIKDHFSKQELLCMLIAALCHDMDHLGYTNSYLINMRAGLAIRYNDISPLENHHCSMCFKIFTKPGCNILANKSEEEYRAIRGTIVHVILATDMANHAKNVKDWVDINEDFDRSDPAQRLILMKMLMKCCDISNEIRPTQVSDKWLDCLLEEYFNQGDLEREMGLPTLPFMDRTKTTPASAQIGFIRFVLIPLFETLKPAFGEVVETWMVKPLRDSEERFTKMKEEEQAEKDKPGKERKRLDVLKSEHPSPTISHSKISD